jgi:Leucine-rich repeat (LRR) protein
MLGSFINKILGTYSDLDKALIKPNKVKRLKLYFIKYDLNKYKEEILKFENLRELSIQFDCSYNYHLPNEIGQLKSLRKLHFLNYNFTEFPNWLFNLSKLENLMLRGNNISTIPSLISELSALKHLKIENTRISTIPNTLKDLKNLKTLSLGDNTELKTLDYQDLPKNLKSICLTPSMIPKNIIDRIIEKLPNLKIGKRYYG